MPKLSVIIPVYFNHDNLKPLYNDLKAHLINCADFEYELVLVDDGSADDSWGVMLELAAQDEHIAL